MPKPLSAILVVAALAAVTGCKKADNTRATTSQVLEGTISDDMIPVATLTSEPPIADPTAAASTDAPSAATGATGPKAKAKVKAGQPAKAEASTGAEPSGDKPAATSSPAASATAD